MTSAQETATAAASAELSKQGVTVTPEQLNEALKKFPVPQKASFFETTAAKVTGSILGAVALAGVSGYVGLRIGRTQGRQQVMATPPAEMMTDNSASVTPIQTTRSRAAA